MSLGRLNGLLVPGVRVADDAQARVGGQRAPFS